MHPKILHKGKIHFSDISVTHSKSNRKKSDNLENEAKKIWKEVLRWADKNKVKVWDSELYRLNSYSYIDNKIKLDLGLIPFSTVRGLKNNPNLSNSDPNYYPKNIFISGLTLTSDEYYLFGIKGENTTSSNKNGIELIGGVLSKDEIKVDSGSDIEKTLYEEYLEETNIKADDIDSSNLLGIIQTEYGSIGLISYTKLQISKEECINRFNDRIDDEIQDLLFTPKSEIGPLLEKAKGFRKLVIDLL